MMARTALTAKEVRDLAISGGEGLLVLADLALEHGNQELAKAAQNAFEEEGTRTIYESREKELRSLGAEGEVTVAVRAARRSLERERAAGRDPDKRSWKAVEAVEAGVRWKDIVDARQAAATAVSSARNATIPFDDDDIHNSSYYAADDATRATLVARAAATAAARYASEAFYLAAQTAFDASDAAFYARKGPQHPSQPYSHVSRASALAAGNAAASLDVNSQFVSFLVAEYEELALQLADIFEVWWESVCARS